MGKCPYCSKELHLGDFFETIQEVTRKGKKELKLINFKGEKNIVIPHTKMWVCPSCDTILGFTEWGR